jgi:CBS domain-containing protein
MRVLKNSLKAAREEQLALFAATAEELMTGNPVSIDQHAPLHDAAAVLTDREINALPVIDDAGRPVGVISRADLVRHDREKTNYLPPKPDYYEREELTLGSGEKLGTGFLVETVVPTQVQEVMTPTVISVPPETSSVDVIAKMVALKVHRLFVVDATGVLIGVISTFDILRCLRRPER